MFEHPYQKKDKVYRGAFNYYKGTNLYCEETYDVYKNKKESSIHYFSEIIARVATGELLKVGVAYSVNKDFIPTKVIIKKMLGQEKTEEVYRFDDKINVIKYKFESTKEKKRVEIPTGPRFHISTPTTVTSLAFFLTKKFDQTQKNTYQSFFCDNHWKYVGPPYTKTISLQRVSMTNEKITVNGADLVAVHYKIQEDSQYSMSPNSKGEFQKIKEIDAYMSKHIAIPYILESVDDGVRIEVKYFNDLNPDSDF
ncbi:MAG: hypothetical protein H6622_12095 [Halobacteriovoraceae bacterium]|nr:hypothetical protein [Halobacteriovoraceae bacterium]